MGSILIGLIKAFKNVQAISGDIATNLVEGIESTTWYPMDNFFNVLNKVCRRNIDYDPILFYAGIAFIEDWYRNGGGKEIVFNALDFLQLQGGNTGYLSVHRGHPNEIGWQHLLELNEPKGYAKIICVNPYPKEFERGVFYGGTLMFNDMQFVQVDSTEEPYNPHLNKKTIVIHFRHKPDSTTDALIESLLATMSPDKPVTFSASLYETIVWRLKSIEQQYQLDKLFYQQSSLLLSLATDEIFELSQKLGKLAHQDELTGLLNRRAIFEQAKNLLKHCAYQNCTIAFILIDIDHFKTINDKWGHAVGDETLRIVSSLLQNCLQQTGLLGRIGGEEFLVVLSNLELNEVLALAEKLRSEVTNYQQFSINHQLIPISISLGINLVEKPQNTQLDHYIEIADQALYHSKHHGRNQVTYFKS